MEIKIYYIPIAICVFCYIMSMITEATNDKDASLAWSFWSAIIGFLTVVVYILYYAFKFISQAHLNF